MNCGQTSSRKPTWILSLAVLLWAAGCDNPFVTKHKVFVDAIAAPGATRPTGQSYRLVPKQSALNQAQTQVAIVKACVDAALSGHGMYEAPPNAAPALVIEVTFGTTASPRADPSLRETFLQLSARTNPRGAIDRATGPEIWDVRVGVMGISGRVENALPLLCAVAADYMGTDTKVETKVEVPQNSPLIRAVREAAIKSLEANAATAAAAPAGAGKAGTPTGASAVGK